MNVGFRAAQPEDFAFARSLYFETMRWMIERLFGWDQGHQEESFAGFFKLDEVRIITVGARDVGWIQERPEAESIYLGGLYVTPAMQRQGIGGQVLETLLAQARSQSKSVTLSVVKINPALHFYERHGFRITHEDEHKFYMRADPLSNRKALHSR
jgi:GNAT superfamily N-acetyltransferase